MAKWGRGALCRKIFFPLDRSQIYIVYALRASDNDAVRILKIGPKMAELEFFENFANFKLHWRPTANLIIEHLRNC